MKRYEIFFIVLSILWFSSSCDKRCEKGRFTDHWYELPVSIQPAKDTFNIGDTIHISFNFSNELNNLHYNKNTRLENFDFRVGMNITDMLTDAPARSYPNAKLTTTVGTTAANTAGTAEYDVFNIGYLYSNNRYEYDAYFIVDKQGFYIINFQSYISGRDDIDISACPSERVKITFNTNQKNENNYRLREGAKDPYYSKMTREAFDESGGYFFYVK